jgi:predicted TIM-barrel fold metal-dependent hydrolase
LEEIASRGRIDRFLVHSVATTPHQVQSINNFIAASVRANPKRLFGFGALHPASEDLAGDLDHLLELGLKGVKMHPDIQAFPLDDPSAMKIYELCEKKNVPVLLHTGDYRYDFSNPNRLLPVLKAFPFLTVIGAHLGGWSVWEEAAEKLAGIPNLYVDCSSTFPFFDVEKAKEALCAFGFDRVLFGSDFPMWHPEKELDTFLSLNLGEEANRMILCENAKKLFGLN